MAMTEPADHRIAESLLPAGLLSRRWHGSLDTITDTERRALRPIGSTAHEVAARTGALLADLMKLPGVRVFQGLLPAAADTPRIPHAISAGRRLLLVESVAWPPGRYTATASGAIHCDGVYIGQSVRPLAAAVRYWQGVLPHGHRVSALVVVHPTTEGRLALPAATARDLSWARADDAVRDIRACLPRRRQPVSMTAVAALAAATEDRRAAGEEIR